MSFSPSLILVPLVTMAMGSVQTHGPGTGGTIIYTDKCTHTHTNALTVSLIPLLLFIPQYDYIMIL